MTAPRCRFSASTRGPSTCERWTCRRAAPSPSRWATTRPRRAPTWRASAPRAACCARSRAPSAASPAAAARRRRRHRRHSRRRRRRARVLAAAEDETLPNALERPQLESIQARLEGRDDAGVLPRLRRHARADGRRPRRRAAAARDHQLLRKLAARHPTAIVSGRSVDKLREWVNVDGLYFAGSHGFEIVGPAGSSLNFTVASQLLPELRDAMVALEGEELGRVAGARLEDNKFSLSVHTRNVSAADLPKVHALVDAALEEQPLLRRHEGIHVIELRPQVLWHKGRAVEWLLKSMCEQLGLPSGPAERNSTALPIYIGDDTTDEDAFGELSDGRGVPIIVRAQPPRRSETAAELWLRDPAEVARFLAQFLGDGGQLVRVEELSPAEGEGEGEGDGEAPTPTVEAPPTPKAEAAADGEGAAAPP